MRLTIILKILPNWYKVKIILIYSSLESQILSIKILIIINRLWMLKKEFHLIILLIMPSWTLIPSIILMRFIKNLPQGPVTPLLSRLPILLKMGIIRSEKKIVINEVYNRA